MVNERDIKANPKKIKAIMELRSLSSMKEVQQLAGKVVALNRFILRLADRNLPFFETLWVMKIFEWTTKCEWVFVDLKSYLSLLVLLSKLVEREPSYSYLAVSKNIVNSILVREENKTHKLVYFVSKILQEVEKRYLEIEKLVLALVVSARSSDLIFNPIKLLF